MGEVRLKDIANKLGVSNVTVSNALNNKPGVSRELKEKIVNLAKNMGYTGVKSPGEGSVIGAIVASKYLEVGTSFYWTLYQNTAYYASKNHQLTMFEVVESEDEIKGNLPKLIREKKVDGLIIIGWMERDYVINLVREINVPAVLLDFYIEGLNCDAVISANYLGMYKATKYLIDKGHKDIAFVGSIYANENIMDRYYGYKKALMESKIQDNPMLLIEDRDIVTGKIKICLPKTVPSAFACNSDLTAGKLYDALNEVGYKVPEDVSITAYDNYLYGHEFAGSLSTYNVDMKAMAENAIKLLLRKIHKKEAKNIVRQIDSIFVERSSVKQI